MTGKSPKTDQESFRAMNEREEGQTMSEYAVVLGVITLAIVGAIGALSGGIISVVQSAANLL
jgi:Flp pilus assembly pilin Flp